MKNMNVLLLSQSFSSTKGGGETLFSSMAKVLADNGNKVWVITNKVKGEQYPQHDNIKLIFVPPLLEFRGGHPPTFKDNLIYVLNTIVKGLSIIKKEKIAIIHSNNFSPSLAGSILSVITSKPHILAIYDIFSLEKNFWKEWKKQKNISKFNAFLAPIFEKLIVKLKSKAIHTISDASKDDLLEFGVKKPIYLITPTIEFNDRLVNEVVPQQFIYIGRLIYYKNLEVVIKAIKILKKSHSKVSLIIVGGGPHRAKLERLVNDLKLEENIKFKGHLPDDEKKRLLSISQALVFPSYIEGFGLVILEAFTQQKPVLVSNVRPMSDTVENNKTGFVISTHDENEWAKVMEKIISDPQKACVMGNAGSELLEKEYNIQRMYYKVIEMYKKNIDEKV